MDLIDPQTLPDRESVNAELRSLKEKRNQIDQAVQKCNSRLNELHCPRYENDQEVEYSSIIWTIKRVIFFETEWHYDIGRISQKTNRWRVASLIPQSSLLPVKRVIAPDKEQGPLRAFGKKLPAKTYRSKKDKGITVKIDKSALEAMGYTDKGETTK